MGNHVRIHPQDQQQQYMLILLVNFMINSNYIAVYPSCMTSHEQAVSDWAPGGSPHSGRLDYNAVCPSAFVCSSHPLEMFK